MQEHKTNQKPLINDELDLLAIVKTFWNRRKTIYKIVSIFIIIGLLVAIFSSTEYTASSTFIPQTSEGVSGGVNLGGLASLAGISLGEEMGGSEIPPILYPKLVSSIPFKMEMLKAPIKIDGINDTITYQEYYENYFKPGVFTHIKNYTIGLPGLIKRSLKKDESGKELLDQEGDIISLTSNQVEHFRRLDNQISIAFNNKEGFVELTVVMPEALAAAQMTQFAEELLQNEVIEFRIQNAREQLKFTQERYQEKKMEFEEIQTRLGHYRDRNQNISSWRLK